MNSFVKYVMDSYGYNQADAEAIDAVMVANSLSFDEAAAVVAKRKNISS
jgi:hypothetical protein|tara:strand:- start:884 stop:1030 length:147 start_codon:yes stop_codon:yes gene_type:complete